MLKLDQSDRWAVTLIIFVFAFIYSYFFQGGGWNQNSRFDTIRAITERGTFEISHYAQNTGDISLIDDRIYSNKPPGIALIGVPAYLLISSIEQKVGADLDHPYLVTANAHLLTFVTSGLPGVFLLVVIFLYFRRENVTTRDALLLAGAFGVGSLILPYAGVMMSHNLVAFCLFATWFLITYSQTDNNKLFFGGALLGIAVLSDYVALPLIAVFVPYLMLRGGNIRELLVFLIGPLIVLLFLGLYHLISFGQVLTTSYHFQNPILQDPQMYIGAFDGPKLIRLYWLTFHPYRGLFYCCPLLLIGVFVLGELWWRRAINRGTLLAIAIILNFIIFNLSFTAWSGGSGIGPRYLVPIMAFLYAYAHYGFSQYRLLSVILILVSAANMIVVTAVASMLYAETFGPAVDFNPVRFAVLAFFQEKISINYNSMLEFGPTTSTIPGISDFWDSYNLGEVVGLRGIESILPVLAILCVFFVFAFRFRIEKSTPHIYQRNSGLYEKT